ncbi:hypothetical protein DPMN_173022 [Dreissena polymorpha]|uniref:Uncharacterized protein n=1 Tax=Dreissena polymorpha TaxID=45954 RepID=A0A9D4IFP6_DREPO|nr:hypothetical protein DPMN_173022 [Dreissena polymorpha]
MWHHPVLLWHTSRWRVDLVLQSVSHNLAFLLLCFAPDIDIPDILQVAISSPFPKNQIASSIIMVNQCILHGGVPDPHQVVENAACLYNQPYCRWTVVHLCEKYLKLQMTSIVTC